MDWLPQFWMDLERKRFKWGEHDCLLFAADALVKQGRPDAAAPYRGAYNSAKSADEVIDAAGGFVALFEGACDAVGIPTTAEGTPGSVAVIRPRNNASATVGAMWTGNDWMFVGVRGVGSVIADRVEVLSTCRR